MEEKAGTPCLYFIMNASIPNKAIKDGTVEIYLDKERKLLCSANVLADIEDKFDGLEGFSEALNGKKKMNHIIWTITQMLNEAYYGEEQFEERQVGRYIHKDNMVDCVKKIREALNFSMTGSTEPEETKGSEDDVDEKNLKAGKE